MEPIEQRISVLRDDRVHGSRWLVREAICIVRDLAQTEMDSPSEQMRLLYQAGRDLAQARPAMAALSSAVGRILSHQTNSASVAQSATRLLEAYDTATERIATYAEPLLHGQLMTCSISGTVLDVLLARQQYIERVITLEGRPRYEGREMARSLSARGLAVSLITDAQADIFLPDCQAVVVGADSILADGSVLNKAGTALLAWAAHGHRIPLYVLCETLKISPRRWSAHRAENMALLEEKEPEEVLEQSIPDVVARNFYFDRTPYRLINKIISERGVLSWNDIRKIALNAQQDVQFVLSSKRVVKGPIS